MATFARLGQVEEGVGHGPSRIGMVHLVAAVATVAIGLVGLVLGSPGAAAIALGAAVFLALSAWYWLSEPR